MGAQVQESVKIRESLSKILKTSHITKVVLVDDQVNISNDWIEFIGKVKALISDETKKDSVSQKFKEVDFNAPEEVYENQLEKFWKDSDEKIRFENLSWVYKENGDIDEERDLQNISTIESYFPNGMCIVMTPREWVEKKESIVKKLPEGEKVLILFDQDLSNGEKGLLSTKGEDLIVEVKEQIENDKFLCALLTHTIRELKDELPKRAEIVNTKGNELSIEDFFPLAKKRLHDQSLFSDGIKKTILNRYCEILKNRSIELIKSSYEDAIQEIRKIDTYAFDHMILKSSLIEGQWEPSTLFRISEIVFRDFLKKGLLSDEFPNELNPKIDLAQRISGIEFKIKDQSSPYNVHLKIRNTELFEAADLINGLNSPIKNGDIFEAKIEGKQSYFILAGQECDLMLRGVGSKKGKRNANNAVLFKLDEIKSNNLEKRYSKRNFSFNKYRLHYYDVSNNEKVDGLVYFKDPVIIDIDILDLAVFNSDGACKLDLNKKLDSYEYLHSPWKDRYDFIFKKLKQLEHNINLNIKRTKSLSTHLQKELLKSSNPKISIPIQIGNLLPYKEGEFDFGIKRIKRFRSPGSENLLKKYTNYISREAEPHDFARDL